MPILIATALVAALLFVRAAEAVEIRSVNFADRWVAPSAELRIRVSQLVDPTQGHLAFVDGNADLTPFFRQVGAAEFVYSGRELPLAPGQRPLKVFLVRDGQWKEIGSIELKVTTKSGLRRFDAKPRLDLSMKGQLDQSRSGDAPPFTRANVFADGTLQGGMTLEIESAGFTLESSANITGSTREQEALQVGTLGKHAPEIDLTDYLVDARWGASQLSAGHINYGNNPLLLMGYGSRGLGYRQQFTERIDFSLNAMNATAITGMRNPIGLDDAQHQVRGGALGVELLERKGGLRVEAQILDASLRSLGAFNAGEIPDAEKISGGGLRIQSATASGRLRGDLVMARVRHTAAEDPTLSQNQTLTTIKPSTKNAHSLDLVWEVVRPAPDAATRLPFGLTATFRNERIDPLYKSVGVGFASDQKFSRIGLNAQLGPIQAQWQASRREDNLENIPTLLKTRTSAQGLNVNLPLAQVWHGADDALRRWLPTLGYRWETNHQYAINVPIAALSAFNATHLPDQLNRVHGLTLNWSDQAWQLSYGFNLATQDNRQLGREMADFHNTSHNVQGSYRFTPTLGLNAGVGRTENYSNESTLANFSYDYSLGFDWQFRDRWSLTGNYALNTAHDSKSLADSSGWSAQTQVAWRFTLPSPDGERKLPGQVFLRHSVNSNFNRDNVFGLLTAGRFWSIQTGMTVSFW